MADAHPRIESPRNAAIAAAARLHRGRHRRTEGLTLLEGPEILAEAISGGTVIRELFGLGGPADESAAEAAGVPLRLVTDRVLERLSGTETPRGPVAVVAIPDAEVPRSGRLLVAWGVGDPGNCGTLIRSAAAFGYGFVAGPDTADPWSPKVIRAAAGGHFHTPVSRVDAVVGLGERTLVATVVTGGDPPGPLPEAAALMIGSEAHGLPPDVEAVCDRRVTIPMHAGESLNAGVAGGILAYLGMLGN